jgi:hypothetical protein
MTKTMAEKYFLQYFTIVPGPGHLNFDLNIPRSARRFFASLRITRKGATCIRAQIEWLLDQFINLQLVVTLSEENGLCVCLWLLSNRESSLCSEGKERARKTRCEGQWMRREGRKMNKRQSEAIVSRPSVAVIHRQTPVGRPSSQGPLLMPQSLNWIEPRCLACREITENNADACGK